jgi:hypothetical protein
VIGARLPHQWLPDGHVAAYVPADRAGAALETILRG